jgi:hypothetical protein
MENFEEYFEFNKSQQENDDEKITEQDIENIRTFNQIISDIIMDFTLMKSQKTV